MKKSTDLLIAKRWNRTKARPITITPTLHACLCLFRTPLFGATPNSRSNRSAACSTLTFALPLSPGTRQEAVGPLYYAQQTDEQQQWALSPFVSHTRTPGVDWSETEILYPLFTWRRYGSEYRAQFFQLLSYSGGQDQGGTNSSLFTIFPLYFQERSTNASLNYTAVAPFYGHLYNRLMRDETKFILFPLYSETRKKDVVTDNYLYPFFHVRHGNQLEGWQFWPIIGEERQQSAMVTNSDQQIELVPGHHTAFALWPFFTDEISGIGGTNQGHRQVFVPFYSCLRSPARDETSYGWPFGYWRTDDRENGYREQDLLWPLLCGREAPRPRRGYSRFTAAPPRKAWKAISTSGRSTSSTGCKSGSLERQPHPHFLFPLLGHARKGRQGWPRTSEGGFLAILHLAPRDG